jgi:bifunctional non-homologous end joining protein LigD
LRYIGDVGTGFTERALDELLDLLNPLIRPTSPFQDEVPADRRRDARWVQPRMVGQVVYRQFTTDHRLRHTAWRGLRHDVLPEQVRWPSSE